MSLFLAIVFTELDICHKDIKKMCNVKCVMWNSSSFPYEVGGWGELERL
jgi:hypothetical protein